MNRRCYLTLTAALLGNGFLSTGFAQTATVPNLQNYLRQLRQYRARFAQAVYDEEWRFLEGGRGWVYLQKPGRFRWQYETPHQQLIVANGSEVFSFDPDLNQVVVRPLAETVKGAPLALLTQNDGDFTADFTVGDLMEAEGMYWYPLQPKREQAISRLWLGFANGDLAGIEIEDQFKQRTRFRFAEIDSNPALDPQLFRFTPPAGAEVIGHPMG